MGPDTLTAATIAPVASTTGALTEATPASRSSTLSTQPRRPVGAAARAPRRPSPGRAAGRRPTGTIVRSPCGDSSDGDADPPVALAHVQLHALARVVAQPHEHRPGRVRPAASAVGGLPQADQAQPEGEPTVGVPAHQPVRLERDGQPVGRGPGEPGARRSARPATAARGSTAPSDGHGLVQHADTAYDWVPLRKTLVSTCGREAHRERQAKRRRHATAAHLPRRSGTATSSTPRPASPTCSTSTSTSSTR